MKNMMERWEYKIIHVVADKWNRTGLPPDVNEQFDRYGAEGWELVSTEGIVRRGWYWGSNTVAIIAVFKRRAGIGP